MNTVSSEDEALALVHAYEHVCSLAIGQLDRRRFDERREGYLALFDAFPARSLTRTSYDEFRFFCTDHEIKFRVYKSENVSRSRTCIVYGHGGGFVSGNLAVCDSIARELSDDLGIAVVTFEYRLSPDHPFPASLEDCFSMVVHLQANADTFGLDANKLYFAGESCGGNFAPAVAMLLRDRKCMQLAGQIPLNPVFDVHRWARREADDGTQAFKDEMHYFTSTYLGDSVREISPYASPLRAADFSSLPPAFIWAAGLDPLHKEALEFAEKLRGAGVWTVVRVKPNVVHGCIRARHYYSFAQEVYKEIVDGIEKLISYNEAR